MARPLRGALIGCGFVAQHHLAAWPRVAGAELVAVCDLHAERLAWAKQRLPQLRPYDNAAALFDAEHLDFVEICTRPGPHRVLTELAASRGAHVLCQKPVAEWRSDLLAMIDACDRAGVRFMVHENWRFRPWYRAMRAAIDRGAIGRPIRLRLAHRDTRALRPDGFADQPYFAEMPRLVLLEMGPHLIDMARYLLGEIVRVTAQLHRFGTGHPGEDVATLLLAYESGASGLLDISWCAPAETARAEWALNETVVEGTEGTLRLRTDGAIDRIGLDGTAEILPVRLPPEDQVYLEGYVATQSHFIAGILAGLPHETSGAESLRTMDALWAGYRSAESGREEEVSRRGAKNGRGGRGGETG
jgi:predicted dehydrogenase